MDRDDISPTTLNFGSPVGSPFKRSCHEDKTGSPVRGMTLFGSPSGSPVRGMTLFGGHAMESSYEMKPPLSAPSKKLSRKYDLFGDKPMEEQKEETFPFVPETYTVDLTKTASMDGIKTPIPQFFKGLENAGSISPTTDQIPSSGEPTTRGSFFGFSPSIDGSCAIKTATVGSDGVGTLNKKSLVDVINNIHECNGSPQCATVHYFYIDHTNEEKKADVTIVQKLCQPLQIGNALPFLLCVISLLRWLIPKRFYPTDLKMGNFGKAKDGNVKWFDFDLKEYKSNKACSLIKSGEFQHDGNPMFQQFLLMLIEFYRKIEENRKSEFAKLNKQAGLLKSLGLLSSEKSISETTIEDFAEVLRNIGLSEEDNAYLVGLLTPPASSQ